MNPSIRVDWPRQLNAERAEIEAGLRKAKMNPFSSDRFVLSRVAGLCALHKVKTIIETGTFQGETTFALELLAERVITIDYEEYTLYHGRRAQRVIGTSPNAMIPFLDSPRPILFFLDAHECGVQTVVREELRVIADHKLFDSVIVIHDVRNPREPSFGYDTYPTGPLDLEYLAPAMKPFEHYRIAFNEEAEGAKRGVLYFTPRL